MGVGFGMMGIITSFLAGRGLKLALGGLAIVTLFAVIQTIRIEGAFCSNVEAGEKPSCIIRGFKQELQITRISLAEAEAYGRAEAAKHKATKQAYVEAQEEAARLESERLARVVARQEEITHEIEAEYRQRIAALRARADRLRAQVEAGRGGGAAGASGDLQLPETGDPAARADAAPDCRSLPAPDLTTEIRCREIAEQQATQLAALIDWVERQFNVQP
jgi:signal transduction histidine kinase